jgi:hypothetical protein
MNQQTVHVYESVADVKGIRTVLPIVPEFVDTENKPVKPR